MADERAQGLSISKEISAGVGPGPTPQSARSNRGWLELLRTSVGDCWEVLWNFLCALAPNIPEDNKVAHCSNVVTFAKQCYYKSITTLIQQARWRHTRTAVVL